MVAKEAAALSGRIHEGDVLLAVDDVPVSGMTGRDVKELTLGPAGSAVTLTILKGHFAAPPPWSLDAHPQVSCR